MTEDDKAALADAIFAEAEAAHAQARRDGFGALVAVADAIAAACAGGGKVLIFGNGGSAGDAQHFATELAVRYEKDRRALAAVALTADSCVLTAVGNDLGFERVFARQVEALGRPGDVAVAITTSGRSPNVLAAVETARAKGLTVVAMTGCDGGPIGGAADLHLNVPQPSVGRVQEVQRTQIHAICALVEQGLAEGGER